ncbi:ankyrin repeat domain-containing protein [Candidatus Babeliales bacterium]|nr:ankyrin repeat domain-containing protein [Candidatus Babeliales bacterium]
MLFGSISDSFNQQASRMLLRAAELGDVNKMQSALADKANPDACTEYGIAALHYLAYQNNVDGLELIISYGGNVGIATKSGKIPLHYAVRQRAIGAVASLLRNKANVNATLKSCNMTVLHLAAYCNCLEIVTLLLEHGANPELFDQDGRRPVDVAKNDAIKELLRSKHVAQVDNL